jgi:hypothetical protein
MDFEGETHNAPCGGFDCRNEGSAYVAGVEDGSEIRNKSTPVLAAAGLLLESDAGSIQGA